MLNHRIILVIIVNVLKKKIEYIRNTTGNNPDYFFYKIYVSFIHFIFGHNRAMCFSNYFKLAVVSINCFGLNKNYDSNPNIDVFERHVYGQIVIHIRT